MSAEKDPRVRAYVEGLKAYALNLPAICPEGLRRVAYFWEHGYTDAQAAATGKRKAARRV